MEIIRKTLNKYIASLFFIFLLSNLLEALGFAIIPFFFSTVFLDKEFTFNNAVLDFISNKLNLSESSEASILFWIGLIFLSKNLILILANYFKYNILYMIKTKIADLLYDSYLKSNLIAIKQKNSSEISRNFITELNLTSHHFLNFANIFQEITITLFLFIVLSLINFKLSIFLLIIICFFGVLINFSIIKKIKSYSKSSLKSRFLFLNSIKQNLESIKEIKVFGKYSFFKNIFLLSFNSNEKSQIRISFFQELPRFILEIMFVLVICLVLFLFINQDVAGQTVLLGEMILFSVMIVRLIPSFNRLNHFINFHFQSKISKDIIFNDLKKFNPLKVISNKKIKNIKIDSIGLYKINFRYNENKENKVFEIKNRTIKFEKNKITSLVGSSGSGKSTIINILCGLLEPKSGEYTVNKNKFGKLPNQILKNMSYLPQQIFLLDETIIRNIAFGESNDQIDLKKINKIINEVGLRTFINKLPKKLNTKIGEKGGILSGGQLQRIGIARSLYFNKKIIILDEPTSSLDNQSSNKIIKILNKLKKNKIIIIVTHSNSVAKGSDKVYNIDEGIVN
tara:strand:- start:1563 stop:3263 length:1701 start_codon:yes stop_codon:yes gene_type:complete